MNIANCDEIRSVHTFRMVDIGNDARARPMLMMHSSLVSMFSMLISGSNLLNEHLSEPMCRKRTSKVIGGTAAVTATVGRVFNDAILPLQKYHQILPINS